MKKRDPLEVRRRMAPSMRAGGLYPQAILISEATTTASKEEHVAMRQYEKATSKSNSNEPGMRSLVQEDSFVGSGLVVAAKS